MIKKLLIALCIFFPALSQGQIIVNAQLPPAGFVQKEQLWDIILINNYEDVMNLSIKMMVRDAVTGEQMLSAQSAIFIMGKGVKQVNTDVAAPVQYNFTSLPFSNNFLPLGTYQICYHVFSHAGEQEIPVTDDCKTIQIDPLSPPLLNTPANNEVIPNGNPQFTWLPPSPVDMFNNLSYQLIVAEVLPGQSAPDAVQFNSPVYSRNNISQPYDNYPASYAALDTGKQYAWQVLSLNGTNYSGKTEVWTFRVDTTTLQTQETGSYILLQQGISGTYILEQNVLHVKYFSNTAVHFAKAIFKDDQGNSIYEKEQEISTGDNYLDFNLSARFKPGKIYTLSITDQKNKTQFIKFSIK